MPGKNPASTAPAGNFLQVSVTGKVVLPVTGDEVDVVVNGDEEDVEVRDVVGDDVLELNTDPSGVTSWFAFFVHVLLLEQLYPNGQHRPAQTGRGVVKSVVFNWLSGCRVAFC
jgi:hypothetical protein